MCNCMISDHTRTALEQAETSVVGANRHSASSVHGSQTVVDRNSNVVFCKKRDSQKLCTTPCKTDSY